MLFELREFRRVLLSLVQDLNVLRERVTAQRPRIPVSAVTVAIFAKESGSWLLTEHQILENRGTAAEIKRFREEKAKVCPRDVGRPRLAMLRLKPGLPLLFSALRPKIG